MHETPEAIRASVRERFSRIAATPGGESKFPVGPASAKALGYDAATLDALPASVTESFAGVGNPLSLGELHPGETVLDLGCGAGLDSILAARRVGPAGKVIGIDFTAAMVEKARGNTRALGLANATFHQAAVEDLPLGDDTVDVAMCNGMFNLCPDKPRALAEVCRVLKPAGRLVMADVLLEEDVTAEEVARRGTWSD